MSSNLKIANNIAIFLLCGAVFASFWLFGRFTVDDAFITWRYGKNLVDFGVWNYNPANFDMTQAYTNPIYAILSIIPNYFKIDVVLFFKIISLLNLIIFTAYMMKKTGKIKTILFFLALPATMVHAFSGLETFLFVSLLVVLFINLYENKFKIAVVTTLVLFLTRPEAWLLAGLVPVYFLVKNLDIDFSNLKGSLANVIKKDNLDFRRFFISTAIFAVFLGAYFAFHKYHFGYALPNTFYVKHGAGLSIAHLLRFTIALLPAVFLLFYRQYKLFLTLFIFFGAFVYSYSTSDLQMNFMQRFAFHIFAPLFFMIIYLIKQNEQMPNSTIKANSIFISKSYIRIGKSIFCISALMLVLFFLNKLPTKKYSMMFQGYSRALDSHAEFGRILNKIKDRYQIHAFSLGDAGMVSYHSQLLALDNVGLGSSLVAHDHKVGSETLNKYNPEILALFFWPSTISRYNQNDILNWAGFKTKINENFIEIIDDKSAKYQKICNIVHGQDYFLGLYINRNIGDIKEIKELCQTSKAKNGISQKEYFKKTVFNAPWSYWHE